MLPKIKNVFYLFCVFYLFADISLILLDHYGLTTRDETCRNEIMAKYYEKHGSLENFYERSSMSNYVLMNGSLDGFEWKHQQSKTSN